jgi:hypothetical protein
MNVWTAILNAYDVPGSMNIATGDAQRDALQYPYIIGALVLVGPGCLRRSSRAYSARTWCSR